MRGVVTAGERHVIECASVMGHIPSFREPSCMSYLFLLSSNLGPQVGALERVIANFARYLKRLVWPSDQTLCQQKRPSLCLQFNHHFALDELKPP